MTRLFLDTNCLHSVPVPIVYNQINTEKGCFNKRFLNIFVHFTKRSARHSFPRCVHVLIQEIGYCESGFCRFTLIQRLQPVSLSKINCE